MEIVAGPRRLRRSGISIATVGVAVASELVAGHRDLTTNARDGDATLGATTS
jgi:hypothetical protein